MARAVLLVLGFAAVALAQTYDPSATTYTGPLFDPSNAPNFDHSTTLNAVDTSASTRTSHITSHISSSTISRSSSAGTTSSPTSVTSAISQSRTTSTVPSTSLSTGAAQVNYAGAVGPIAGGVLAGLILM